MNEGLEVTSVEMLLFFRASKKSMSRGVISSENLRWLEMISMSFGELSWDVPIFQYKKSQVFSKH